ncbi:MAG: hypothetical protein IIA72_13860 [Proteobacteria bacterium]|nr:hypothetical protein [Pseudomonadota bacterium]
MILIPESGCAVVKSQGYLGNAGLEAIANPSHEEYDYYVYVYGDEFDPDYFDFDEVNKRLEKIKRKLVMPVTNPYTKKQLRKLVLLLQELKLEDYAASETWTINRLVQPWAGFIDAAGIHYISVMRYPEKLNKSASKKVRKELNSLRRLIKRSPDNPDKISRRCQGLSNLAKGMLNLGAVDVGIDVEETIRGIERSKRTRQRLFVCVDKATAYLKDPPGPPEDIALLEFATTLTEIYMEATGRKIARGFQYEDPEYHAPLERFMLAAIKPVRQHTSVDSVRGLIRKIQRRI